MVSALQRRGQLCDVWRHSAHGDGVQRLPGEHGDAHGEREERL